MSKTLAVYVGVAIATLIGHYTLNTQRQISNLELKEKIQADQIVELISDLQQANQKNETLKTEGYVAGVSDAINKPDHYMAIWHHGYDRGAAVQADLIQASMRPMAQVAPETPVDSTAIQPKKN